MLERMAKLAREFDDLYQKHHGFVGVSDGNKVQLTGQYYMANFDNPDNIREREDKQCRVSSVVDGVEYFALISSEKAEKYKEVV